MGGNILMTVLGGRGLCCVLVGVWLGYPWAVDHAVDGGAADAVFLGEIGEGDVACGVAAADGAVCCWR